MKKARGKDTWPGISVPGFGSIPFRETDGSLAGQSAYSSSANPFSPFVLSSGVPQGKRLLSRVHARGSHYLGRKLHRTRRGSDPRHPWCPDLCVNVVAPSRLCDSQKAVTSLTVCPEGWIPLLGAILIVCSSILGLSGDCVPFSPKPSGGLAASGWLFATGSLPMPLPAPRQTLLFYSSNAVHQALSPARHPAWPQAIPYKNFCAK